MNGGPGLAGRTVSRLMLALLLGLLPGTLLQALLIDGSLAPRAAWAMLLAVLVEAVLLALRQRPLRAFLGDFSAPITGLLLALLLPPLTPWWLTASAVVLALAAGKHAFGGLGDNPFNPAMVGYAATLLLFPSQAAQTMPGPPSLLLAGVLTAAAFTLPGLLLAWRRQIAWQAPLALLLATALGWLALRAAAGARPTVADALAQFSPALALAAFFIVSDPVTGCLSARGRLLFGAGVGVLWLWLERWPGSPQGLPFAVLAMNALACWIDRHTRPTRMRVDASAIGAGR